MTDVLPGHEPYLMPKQEERIASLDMLAELPPAIGQEYPGATTLVPKTLSTLLRNASKDLALLQAHTFTRPNPAYTPDELAPRIQRDAYVGTLTNAYFGSYGRMAEIVTGHAAATGSAENLAHGFELGKRIISERARSASLTMAAGCILLLNPTVESDDPSLFERAKRRHQVERLKQTVTIPPREGERFDTNMQRILLGDFGPGTPRHPLIGKGVLSALTSSRKLGGASARILVAISDPERMGAALEEALDTFSVPVNMDVDDREVEAITATAIKIGKYIQNAAKKDQLIREDPRLAQISFLMRRLQGTRISGELAVFQKRVTEVKKRELDLKR